MRYRSAYYRVVLFVIAVRARRVPIMVGNTKVMWIQFWLLEIKRPKVLIKLAIADVRIHLKLYRKRYATYFAVAFSSCFVGLGSLWAFTDVLNVHYLVSNLVAFVVCNVYWIGLQSALTFRDRRTSSVTIMKALGTRVGALLVSEGLMALLVESAHLWYVTAWIIVTLTVAIMTYTISTLWVWNKRVNV